MDYVLTYVVVEKIPPHFYLNKAIKNYFLNTYI